jgi:hypothetical protein
MAYQFKYNCINPNDLDELEVIIDDLLDDIPYSEFSKKISFKEINDALGGVYQNEEQIAKDWAIRFYIGAVEYNDEMINYACIVWSAIEHIWKYEN